MKFLLGREEFLNRRKVHNPVTEASTTFKDSLLGSIARGVYGIGMWLVGKIDKNVSRIILHGKGVEWAQVYRTAMASAMDKYRAMKELGEPDGSGVQVSHDTVNAGGDTDDAKTGNALKDGNSTLSNVIDLCKELNTVAKHFKTSATGSSSPPRKQHDGWDELAAELPDRASKLLKEMDQIESLVRKAHGMGIKSAGGQVSAVNAIRRQLTALTGINTLNGMYGFLTTTGNGIMYSSAKNLEHVLGDLAKAPVNESLSSILNRMKKDEERYPADNQFREIATGQVDVRHLKILEYEATQHYTRGDKVIPSLKSMWERQKLYVDREVQSHVDVDKIRALVSKENISEEEKAKIQREHELFSDLDALAGHRAITEIKGSASNEILVLRGTVGIKNDNKMYHFVVSTIGKTDDDYCFVLHGVYEWDKKLRKYDVNLEPLKKHLAVELNQDGFAYMWTADVRANKKARRCVITSAKGKVHLAGKLQMPTKNGINALIGSRSAKNVLLESDSVLYMTLYNKFVLEEGSYNVYNLDRHAIYSIRKNAKNELGASQRSFDAINHLGKEQ